MTPERAAEVLRGDNDPSARDLAIAAKLGADALELLGWVERLGIKIYPSGQVWVAKRWTEDFDTIHTHGATPIEAMRNARAKWEKERKG